MDRRISIGQLNVKKGEPWFEDGNIMLITQEDASAFRVHRGVLSRHSEVFNDMFGLPQSSSLETEYFEGCQVVFMYDLPSELSTLIKAIYDGSDFLTDSAEAFFNLSGALRLATKYFLVQIRRQAIQTLIKTWPTTLKGHDEMVEAALDLPSVDNLTYPYIHPLHALNLAREANVNIIVPSALYFLSMYPLSGILQGDHPKLASEHPSKPSSSLAPSDVLLYSLMYQHRLHILDHFIRQFCTQRSVSSACGEEGICAKGFSRLVSQLLRSWNLRTGPLYLIVRCMQRVANDSTVCVICRDDFLREASSLRQKIWDELPSICQLPRWDEIQD